MIQVLAGAVALAGVGYVLARRSSTPARGSAQESESSPFRGTVEASTEPPLAIAAAPLAQDLAAPSSDALDLSLDLNGVFDRDAESGLELTAQPSEHVPSPRSGDDEDAPSPDDLGLTWLKQATASETSANADALAPDIENLPLASDEIELGDANDSEADDETVREYVRRHRISSIG